eukprot:746570-Rhodomonas_salina.4
MPNPELTCAYVLLPGDPRLVLYSGRLRYPPTRPKRGTDVYGAPYGTDVCTVVPGGAYRAGGPSSVALLQTHCQLRYLLRPSRSATSYAHPTRSPVLTYSV